MDRCLMLAFASLRASLLLMSYTRHTVLHSAPLRPWGYSINTKTGTTAIYLAMLNDGATNPCEHEAALYGRSLHCPEPHAATNWVFS